MSTQTLDYGCLMLKLNIPKWDLLIAAIKPDHLWMDRPGFGAELEPHVTILFGFTDKVKPEYIKDCVYSISKPIELQLESISYFENPEFDVVKFDVHSPKLNKLNEIFSKFPHVTAHPIYQPHVTMAYVKKGMAEQYARNFNPIKIKSNTYIYSEGGGKAGSGRKWVWENDGRIRIKQNQIWYTTPGSRI